MIGSITAPSPLNRDRLIVVAGLLVLIVASWSYLFFVSTDMKNPGMQMSPEVGNDMRMSAVTADIMPWGRQNGFPCSSCGL